MEKKIDYKIRELVTDDYKELFKVWNDESVIEYTLTNPNLSLENAEVKVRDILADKNSYAFVCELESGEIVGLGILTRTAALKQSHTGSITVMISTPNQGKGIGGAFFEKILDFADNELKLKILELKCQTRNANGLNLYKKFGFEIEGTLRKRTKIGENEYADLFIMSRIKI
jgi:putative acetyltransferase